MKLTDCFQLTNETPHGWSASVQDAESIRTLVQASGTTKEGALFSLMGKIRAAFEGDYDPLLLSFRGESIFIFRDPQDGWVYSRAHQHGEIQAPSRGGAILYATKAEAERAARFLLAQNCWEGDEEHSPIIDDAERQAEFTRWAQWQKRYKAAKDQGATDDEARERAYHIQ